MISLITFAPAIAALLILFTSDEKPRVIRLVAFFGSFFSLFLTLMVWVKFDPAGGLQFVERHSWISLIGVDYFVGVDGVSLLVILLTAILFPICLLASGDQGERSKTYFFLISLQFTGLFGAFTALNFFHWFLFWEAALVPAFFLIKLFGGEDRASAALNFFLFTVLGSVAMLIGFIAVFLEVDSFDFIELAELGASGELFSSLGAAYPFIFLAILLGLWVKVPLFPLHLWQPSAYAEAPTAVSMLLTGVLSKMGVYAFLRLVVPLFPEALREYSSILLGLALVTILWGAFLALRQTDLKKLLAYSSLNHVAYCMLGIFAAAAGTSVLSDAAQLSLQGATLQMFAHGVAAAGLFYGIGLLEERRGMRELDSFGGIGKVMPRFAVFFYILTFCSIGLPFLAGFAAEFLIFGGSFAHAPVVTSISVIGLLATAVFLLTVLQKVFTGPLCKEGESFGDLSTEETSTLLPLLVLVFWVGIAPAAWLELSETSISALSALFR